MERASLFEQEPTGQQINVTTINGVSVVGDHNVVNTRLLAAVEMIDDLDRQIAGIDAELRTRGAEHRYMPLLSTIPGIAWVLGYPIAAEIGDITRFASRS